MNKRDLIVADRSNLDAIAQMQRKGWNVVAVDKPPGSRMAGLHSLLSRDWYITRDSKNFKIEQENFKYAKRNGEWLDEPIKKFDDLIDSTRYWLYHHYPSTSYRKRSKHRRKVRAIKN